MGFLTSVGKIFTSQLRTRGGAESRAATGAIVLDGKSSNFQRIDPDGSSRTVTLPAASPQGNAWFVIYNAADAWGELITVKDAAGNSKAVLNRAEAVLVACDGETWHVFQFDYKDFGAVGLKADVVGESTSNAGVTIDGCLVKDGRAAALATGAMFLSTEITGNGSSQDTAHSLGAVPSLVLAVVTEVGGDGFDVAAGTHDATNAKFTVTSGVKYRVFALK